MAGNYHFIPKEQKQFILMSLRGRTPKEIKEATGIGMDKVERACWSVKLCMEGDDVHLGPSHKVAMGQTEALQ